MCLGLQRVACSVLVLRKVNINDCFIGSIRKLVNLRLLKGDNLGGSWSHFRCLIKFLIPATVISLIRGSAYITWLREGLCYKMFVILFEEIQRLK